MTDVLLVAFALSTMTAAGCGGALLLQPRHRAIQPLELASLSWLLGAAVVSLASFCLGSLFRGLTLRLLVAGACGALAAGGLMRALKRRLPFAWPRDLAPTTALLAAVAILQAGIVSWLAVRTPLGWDGLVVWEMKARFAWLNGGVVPAGYFSDPTRYWSQPDYPLHVALVDAWIYGWLGRPDQRWIKIVFPLYYLTAVALLFLGARTLGGRRWQAALAALLPFFVPQVLLGDGSASSGYADFPLGVYYFACISYLLAYERTGAPEELRTAGLLAAVLPWVKQEGMILWGFVLALSAVAVWRRTRSSLLWVLVPGAVVLIGWRLFLYATDTIMGTAFLPIRLKTFLENADRIAAIVPAVGREMAFLPRWGLLWFAFPVAVLGHFLLFRNRRQTALVTASVAVPIALYSAIYVFSAWDPFILHLENSLPRLLLQVTLPATLLLALAWPGPAGDTLRGGPSADASLAGRSQLG